MSHLQKLSCAVAVCLAVLVPADAYSGRTAQYQTGFTRWRAADRAFDGWQRSGVLVAADGALELNASTATAGTDPYGPGGFAGRNYYNGGSFLVGEAIGPAVPAGFSFTEAIASWNAETPAGSWIEVQIRAQFGTRWSKWYSVGIWASDSSTVERHSVTSQSDTDGYVATDTLVVTNKKVATSAVQLKVRLFRASGSAAIPAVWNASVALSTTPATPSTLAPGNPALWNRVLAVTPCSQMVYPDGGEVWCSPTSSSMVVGYWTNDTGPCEPRVRAAVSGTYDWYYGGNGNWPFNAAYAAGYTLDGYVARFTSLAQVEPWIAAGVPVVISFAFSNGELTGAPIPSSNGHLSVIVGFDAAGNPVVNDTAAPSDATVRRTYVRSELETVWLRNSGGTVYLMYPPGWSVPAL